MSRKAPKVKDKNHPSGLQPAKLKRSVREKLAKPAKVQNSPANPAFIRYTNYRRKLIDADNAVTKWVTDQLRYISILSRDDYESLKVTVLQIKVKTEAEERTVIEIFQ